MFQGGAGECEGPLETPSSIPETLNAFNALITSGFLRGVGGGFGMSQYLHLKNILLVFKVPENKKCSLLSLA